MPGKASNKNKKKEVEDEDVDLASMKKLMLDAKVDGNKSVWTATLETFGMADGKTKKNDIIVNTMEEGLRLLNEYVQDIEKSNKSLLCWDLVPLKEFGASRDDFFTAFLGWAEKKEEVKTKDGRNFTTTKINVSKASRRMESYFEWMQNNRKDLQEPLTLDSIKEAAKLWDIQITYDHLGHFVWWIDLGSLDHRRADIKKIDNKDHLRYVVWFSHLVMFDKKAQENGAMIIEDMGHLGFFKMATLLPNELSTKLDRFTVGILPVKMKAIYVFGAATWMAFLMALLKPFMGKKMKERMILLPNKTNMQSFCDDLVQRKNIPEKFCGLQGEVPRDAVFDSFTTQTSTI